MFQWIPSTVGLVEVEEEITNSNPYFNFVSKGKEQFTRDEIKAEIEEAGRVGAGRFILQDKGNNIGVLEYLLHNASDHCTWLGLLLIKKECHGQGYGTRALLQFEQFLRGKAISKYRIGVIAENEPAHRFWGRHGFQKVGATINQDHKEFVIYEKVLHPVSSEVWLVKPNLALEDEYKSFYEEWKSSGENMVPWVISKDPSNFQSMLQSLTDSELGEGLPEGWVPDSTYWLVDGNCRVLGAVNIRHRLNESLYSAGGHIGYGIRPSERRKGYAAKLLELSLLKAKELGIDRVLVVCDSDNIASERIILKNGGVRDTDFVEEDGNMIKRFWINTSVLE